MDILYKIWCQIKRPFIFVKEHLKNLRVVIISAMSFGSLLALIIFSLFMYMFMRNIVEENASTNAKQIVSQTAVTIDGYVDNMLAIAKSISQGLKYNQAENLNEYLDSSIDTGNDIVSITLFRNNEVYAYAPSSNILKEGATLSSQLWYEPTSNNSLVFSSPHVQNLFTDHYPWVITLYTNISFDGRDYIMAIDMNFSSIDDYCSQVNVGKRGYIFLINENSKIIYHPQQQLLYAGIKEENIDFLSEKEDGEFIYDDNIVYVVNSLKNAGWKAIGISYMDDSYDTMNEILFYMAIVFGIMFILILVIATMVSKYISHPIGRIIKAMENAQENQFTAFVSENNYIEAQKLSNSYNNMTLKIRQLMEQIRHEQRALRKTEIRALQAQINPHFLYNTLDSILWMCERGDNKGAAVMVSALGNLFRVSLSKGKEIITLKEELSHAENYLLIQGIRYKDQFHYSISAPDELLDCRVPKIIIQPFLENTIYHGFSRAVDKGLIQIRVSSQNDILIIQIEDNGVGMPNEVVEKFKNGEIVKKKNSSGIGISNVDSRIKIYFGKQYGIEIKSIPDQGTIISISLPLNFEDGDIDD